MARIRSNPSVISQNTRNELVESLVKAIKDEDQAEGPVIFEVASGTTDHIEVIVIWNRWADLSADIRTMVVLDAYQQASMEYVESVSVDRISTILPFTVGQAIELSILPYFIQCNVHKSQPGYDRIARFLKGAGALETDAGIELRLPTLEMAKEAKNRLEQGTQDMDPEVHWRISRQVGNIAEY